MKSVNAEEAFALIYELYKEHPWLNNPGIMQETDAHAEKEAVAFLLAGDMSRQWGEVSPEARRVAASLILDFIMKLNTDSSITRLHWQVDETEPAWHQALEVIAAQIRKSHPELESKH